LFPEYNFHVFRNLLEQLGVAGGAGFDLSHVTPDFLDCTLELGQVALAGDNIEKLPALLDFADQAPVKFSLRAIQILAYAGQLFFGQFLYGVLEILDKFIATGHAAIQYNPEKKVDRRRYDHLKQELRYIHSEFPFSQKANPEG